MNKRRLSDSFCNLVGLMEELRAPAGCPWDARQTDSTIKLYLLEEAYEVLDAIERGTQDDVCEELGDLLFQIIFLARLAEERKEFDIIDIIEKITQKMIRRHPHVFGTTEVRGPEEVTENWQRIKEGEKNDSRSLSERLTDIPVDLPSLLRAHRICERASQGGTHPHDEAHPEDKLKRATRIVQEQIGSDDETKLGTSIGDLLFLLSDLARKRGLNAEDLLRKRNQMFINQVGRQEKEGG